MIRTKKELKFYIMADRMMNRGCFKSSIGQRIKEVFLPDYIMRYLVAMRKVSYYNHQVGGVINRISSIYNNCVYRRLGMKLGYSIGPDVFGYGLVIPHYGTIVAYSKSIGNYAVLHTSTCITDRQRTIGNGLYLSTGAKITTGDNIGDGVTIAANSVVTKGEPLGYALLAGTPAVKKTERKIWYEQEAGTFQKKVRSIEELKISIGL